MASAFAPVRCPHCNRRIADAPMGALVEVRTILRPTDCLGSGLLLRCEKCHRETEIILHRHETAA